MLNIILPYLLFAIGLVMLIKGGDWFVDGATGIAHRFHIPEIIIGATVVSIGTTLPEVMVSAGAAMTGHGDIAYGNAIGSIICNTALISAISITVKPSSVDKKTLIKPVIFFFVAAIYYAFVAYFLKSFTRIIGISLLLLFVIYMVFTIIDAKKNMITIQKTDDESDEKSPLKDIILLIIGAVLIAVGARLLVDNGTKIAESMGVPESVIALTFVALGTSLPELVTAITSLRKGHGLLSLGNIVGANLFNLVLVSGTAITINPFNLPDEKMFLGQNASLIIDIPVMFLVMLILTLPAVLNGKLKRWQGITMLLIYSAFVAFQFFI